MEYLKKPRVTKTSDISKTEFHKFYNANRDRKLGTITRATYKAFIDDLFEELGLATVLENMNVELPLVGTIRIMSIQSKIVRKDGSLAKRCPDWKRTWEYWNQEYPNLTRDEIIGLENKLVVFHENEHTDGEFYKFHWERKTMKEFNNATLYKFEPLRHLKRLLSKEVSKPIREVFYFN